MAESLRAVLRRGWRVSMKLVDAKLSPEDGDLVGAWADGLTEKYYMDRASGHCSPADFRSFDPGAFEEQCLKEIAHMETILAGGKKKD